MSEERTFTWFPKITRVMQTLPTDNVAEFAMAVAEYGTNGTEPSFSSPVLAAVFEGIREDIDNSVNARHRNKGGRPRKNARENGGSRVFETQETPVSQNENRFSETETPVSCFENHGEEVPEIGNPSYINQTKPYHTKPIQTKTNQEDAPFPEDDPEANAFAEFAAGCLDAVTDDTSSDYRWGGGGRLALDLRRMFDAGRTVDDARAVVRRKRDEWRGSKRMAQHIRPETLFGEKFESYLNEKGADHADAGVYASAF